VHGFLYRHWYGTKDNKRIIVCTKRRFLPWTPEKTTVYFLRGPGFLWEELDLTDTTPEEIATMLS